MAGGEFVCPRSRDFLVVLKHFNLTIRYTFLYISAGVTRDFSVTNVFFKFFYGNKWFFETSKHFEKWITVTLLLYVVVHYWEQCMGIWLFWIRSAYMPRKHAITPVTHVSELYNQRLCVFVVRFVRVERSHDDRYLEINYGQTHNTD